MTTGGEGQQPVKRGAEDSGRYFRYMAEFVGFTEDDVRTIQQTRSLLERHLPEIVGAFYTHLLRYPPTRRFFLKKDGTVDQEYLQLRMRHLSNFWMRTAEGVFDDDYARYVDYVGRAHTSHGADPNIYIAERYVIGQVGFMQHAISQALSQELRDVDDELEFRAVEAWDKLMMVLLELLARAYGREREAETYEALVAVDREVVAELATQAVRLETGQEAARPARAVVVAEAPEIPEGERKIVAVDGLSIGVFHHKGQWIAVRNSCVHRGGPVATGSLDGDTLICPWHGFQYNLPTGICLVDPSARLDTYSVIVEEGKVILQVPDFRVEEEPASDTGSELTLKPNEFRVGDIPSGGARVVEVDGEAVAVFHIEGTYYATQDSCTHTEGPLSEGEVEGTTVTCFLHGSRFDLTTGQVLAGPAKAPLKLYSVVVDGEVGRVESMVG
jgi:nitrite reductase/ring-hydroxylating ferredoxin subunit/hemoglobin-like flavoprotein